MNWSDTCKWKTFCEEHIFPVIAEKMGFRPEFKLEIVQKEIYEFVIGRKYPEEDPNHHYGILARKAKTIFVREDNLPIIAFAFVHELMHIFYLPKDGESYLHYEMRIRFLAISVFCGLMIYVLEEKAREYIDEIPFKTIIPDYLKK